MIISKTPYRISFAGGLSDLESYYKHNNGYVVSTTIDKYMYITISKRYDGKSRLVYSNIEEVDDIDSIKHPLIRECLKYTNIKDDIEIISLADIPSGTGLGSSSAYTVGLLNALYTYTGKKFNKYKLAEDACKIEIELVGEPIGKQDQYASAFGGLNEFVFKNKSVKINPLLMDVNIINKLQESLMLFYTNIQRKSSDVLTQQKNEMNNIQSIVTDMTWIAQCIYSDFSKNDISKLGYYLNKEWELKKTTGKVSNEKIDDMCNRALNAGSDGIKICGAGSGGFLLVSCDVSKQNNVRKELSDLREFEFRFEEDGTRIIYNKN